MRARATTRSFLVVTLALVGFVASSHAGDPEPESLESQRAKVQAAEAALAAWAKSEPTESTARERTRAFLADGMLAALARARSGEKAMTAEELSTEVVVCHDLAAEIEERRRDLLGEGVQLGTFDVRGIINAIPSFPAPDTSLPASTPAKVATAPKIVFSQDPRGPAGSLIDADKLKEIVDCKLGITDPWDAPSEICDGILLVRAHREKLVRVASLLDTLRQALAARLGVEVRAYRMSRELWAELASEREGVALTDEGERHLERAAHDPGLATLVASQRLIAADGEQLHAFQGRSWSYISGVETSGKGIDLLVQPRLTTVHEGVLADLTPTTDQGGRTATVEIAFRMSERAAGPTKESSQGYDLQLPDLSACGLATALSIPFERAALVGGSFSSDEPLASVVLVRVTRAPPLDAVPPRVFPSPPRPTPFRTRPLPESEPELARLSALIDVLSQLPESQPRGRDYRLALIDVHDLLATRAWREARAFGIGAEPIRGCEADERGTALEPDKLVELVKSMTGAEATWGDPASCDLHRGSLIVNQTDEVLASIDHVLATLRKGAVALDVELEASYYELRPAFLAEVETLSRSDGGTFTSLAPAALERLDEAARTGSGARHVGGSVLVARTGERSYVSLGNERAFLSGYGEAPGTALRPPIVSSVRTGTRLVVAPELVLDASGGPPRISIGARTRRTHLDGMTRSLTPEGALMAPIIAKDIESDDRVFVGGPALLLATRSPGTSRDGSSLALVLRARSLATSEARARDEMRQESAPARPFAKDDRARLAALALAALAVVAFSGKALARYSKARRVLLRDTPRSIDARLRAGEAPGALLDDWAQLARPLLRSPNELLAVAGVVLVAQESGSLGNVDGSHAGSYVAALGVLAYAALAVPLALLGRRARRLALLTRNDCIFPE